MSLKPLTDITLKKLAIPASGQKVIYEPSGLGIRVSQGGTKSFVIQVGTQRRRVTLGRYPQMSLKAARLEACRLIAEADPNNVDKPSTSLIEEFLRHCSRKNKPRTVRDYTRILNKHFPKISIRSVDRLRLQRKLQSLSATPSEQYHATVVFKTFLNWCVNAGHLELNPLSGVKNQGHVKSRDRVLSDDELIAVWKALPSDRFGIFIKLLILTGQRKSEIPHLTISDGLATLPGQWAKNGREHTFPIGPITLAHFVATDWDGWSKSKARLDNASGVTGWTFHDLRRTFATNHARLGTPIHVIEKMLNHVSGTISGVAAVYNRYGYIAEMTDACEKYENWLALMLDLETMNTDQLSKNR